MKELMVGVVLFAVAGFANGVLLNSDWAIMDQNQGWQERPSATSVLLHLQE